MCIRDSINTGGAGMLDRLAAGREPDPRGLRTLSGKFVAVDAAWGRSEAQLTLNEQRLTSVRDAADAAGAGAAGALSALDGILTTNFQELAAQGEALSGLLGDMRGLLERIAALEPGDTAGAEALKAELADTTARADEAAAMTLEKVEEVEEDSAEQLEEIIREVAEITAGTRPGFASFDFAGSGADGVASQELQKLLGDDVDLLLTEAQQRFRLDALFNETHRGDRVVIDAATLLETLRAGSREDGFDPAAALTEVLAWTYAHEIAHTLGLPDLYDFETGAPLDGAGIMGARNDFTVTDGHRGVVAFASDDPAATRAADLTAIYEMLRTARDNDVLGDDGDGGRSYLFAPPAGSRPLLDTGWQILGDVQATGEGDLIFTETGVSRTSAYRALVVPATATEMSFTLRSRLPFEGLIPPDAFEMALLRQNGTPFTRLPGFIDTDAALNLQADGTLRLAPGVTSTAPSDSDAQGFVTRTITVDLAAIGSPARMALSLDLLGFGRQTSAAQVIDLQFDVPSGLENTPPVLTAGTVVTLDEDSSALIDLRGLVTDPEGDPLQYEITVAPERGTLAAVEPGVWRYTPAADFSGRDRLLFTATDGVFRPVPVELALIVRPVNDAPVIAATGPVTVAEGDTLVLQLSAVDPDGDAVAWSIEDGAPGATLGADGILRWSASVDGPSQQVFRILADDGNGGRARRSVTVDVTNAAPVLTLSVPAEQVVETVATVRIQAADPGGDAIGAVTLDWGDGTVVELPAGTTQASHTYTRLGEFVVTARAADGDGAVGTTRDVIEVVTPGLRVTQVTAGAWGVNVRFNEPVDTGLPNPYRLPGRPGEPVDVMLLDAEGNPVRGSLVPDADARGFTFLASGDALPPGDYRIQLSATDLGWRSRWDVLEAGPTGVEERRFTIPDAPVSLHLEGAVQAPGAAIGLLGRGLVLGLDQSGGLRSMIVEAGWDATVMTISGLISALPGAQISRVDDGGTAGLARFRIAFETPPAAGRLDLARLTGTMDAGADYGVSGVPLSVRVIEVNGAAVLPPPGAAPGDRAAGAAPAADAVSMPGETRAIALVARRGDADGDGVVSASDLARFDALPQDDLVGLDAWSFIDPNLLRPVPGFGTGDVPVPDPVDALFGAGARSGPAAGAPGANASRTFDQAVAPSAMRLMGLTGDTPYREWPDRLLHLRYAEPEPLCLVPEADFADATAAVRAARAGLCFDGLPADLSDADQLWRLSGITPVTGDPVDDTADEDRICVTGILPEGAETGDLFRLVPRDPAGAAAEDATDMPPQDRMCFEADGEDPAAAPVTAPEPQADAADEAAVHGRTYAPGVFTALALMSAAVPPRAESQRRGARRAILLEDDSESDG